MRRADRRRGLPAGPGDGRPGRIAVSSDGDDVYLTSFGANSGLVEFDRNKTTGVLTPRAGTRGCIVAGAAAGCATANQLSSFYDVKLSPDSRFLYVGSFDDSVFGVFKRDSSGPVCGNGSGR